MDTSTTETGAAADEKGGGEGGEGEVITVPKSEYDKLNQTIGSMKRELKDLKKPKEEPKPNETQQTKPDESVLLQKIENMTLRQAGLTHEDDVALAKATAKKWNVDLDVVLTDPDFKAKLERQQTGRANADATSDVRGGQGTSQAKNSPEYWIAKGTPPTAADVPDRKTRAKIARAFVKGAATGGKTFYNS